MTMGVSLFGCGIWAYAAKRSLPSLIASCTFGCAYLCSAYLIKSNQNPQLGHDIAVVSSALLSLTMGQRVLKNKSYRQPLNIATIMTVSGIVVGGYNLNKSLMYRQPAEIDWDTDTKQQLADNLKSSS
eukprot:CAMPEP_0202706520 /NCGR_PEP_ID=MMETSP1385-20130828/18933_1 /ASSEMBLY_ACC=CAM_ASM_000861 /TAXON_ID=933848 /ORGANISM="Elphidium margaritaceum" /LENGTH=127 /DNA_ID=CAMNT_0049365013 /DNA_START=47 /DNA_END=430 /DNA_ORIENTATION=-